MPCSCLRTMSVCLVGLGSGQSAAPPGNVLPCLPACRVARDPTSGRDSRPCRKPESEVHAEGALWVLGCLTIVLFMMTIGYGIGENGPRNEGIDASPRTPSL